MKQESRVHEIKIRVTTKEFDLENKSREARGYIQTGEMVKLVLQLRKGEEHRFPKGQSNIQWIANSLADVAREESTASLKNRTFSVTLCSRDYPKPKCDPIYPPPDDLLPPQIAILVQCASNAPKF